MQDAAKADMMELEIFVGYNEDGDCIARTSEEDVASEFDDEIGGYQRRIFKITIKVPCLATHELELELPAEAIPTASV